MTGPPMMANVAPMMAPGVPTVTKVLGGGPGFRALPGAF